MPDLSIVIVTWNAKQFVRQCLVSVVAEAKRYPSAEIIVVDNNSFDGTRELVQETFPSITLINTGDNLGFAKGTNIGIRAAKGEYVYLINSDVTVPDGCFEKTLEFMMSNPKVGLLGPKMMGPDGKVQRSTMRYPSIWNTFCHALALDSIFGRVPMFGGYLMKDFGHDKTRDVEVLNGWFWIVRKKAIDQVGLLDERFFIYGEDIDWSRRFHLSGWRVVFFHDASAIHYGGASSARAPIRFYIEMQRANIQYWKKHTGWLKTTCYIASLYLQHSIRILGHSVAYACSGWRRTESVFKIRRSAASILWLSGRNSFK